MEIFNEYLDPIVKDIDIIREEIIKSKPNRLADNFSVLSALLCTMGLISNCVESDAMDIISKNKKYYNESNKKKLKLYRKLIDNFISEKEEHHEIANSLIKTYDKEFCFYKKKPLYLSENQMYEIIYNFLNDEFNQASEFSELVNNGYIYKADNDDNDCAGYTIYNCISKNSFIIILDNKYITDIDMMRVLVHEFGHVINNNEKNNSSRKQELSGGLVSSYIEVYSLLYEKLFLDYLIKNKIFPNNSIKSLKDYYFEGYSYINSLEYLSSLKDSLLKKENYLKKAYIKEQLLVDENGKSYIPAFATSNIGNALSYSYGILMANYLAELKHKDEDTFNKNFDNFKLKRYNSFDFNIFNDIGTNKEDIIKTYDESLKQISTKKIILK